MARVIVSAGHTQSEPGAVVNGLREVDLTYEIAKKVVQFLRDRQINVLSVPPNLDLNKRIEWINATGYSEETEDICIEIHINDGGKSGFEGWYKEGGKNESERLTKCIIKAACKETKLKNQGVKSELDHPLKTLAFVHNTNPTSSLIECLYIDNKKDQEFLKNDSKLNILAGGIVRGIMDFFGIKDDSGSRQTKSVYDQGVSPYPQAGNFPSYQSPMPQRSSFSAPGYGGSFGGVGGGYGTSGYGSSQTDAQSREDRKKMIEDKYHLILGRKVSKQDLDYFLNLRLSEQQMLKRLVESQEHADLVKESQEYKKVKPEYDKLTYENNELKSQIKDKEGLLERQNDSLSQKNRKIEELMQELSGLSEEEAGDTEPGREPAENEKRNSAPRYIKPRKENFIDKILKKLNDIFD